MTLLMLLFGIIALILLDVPIAVVLGIVATAAIVAAGGIGMLPDVAIVLFAGATKFPLIAIPLFVLAGAIMNASGISRRLVAFASALLGFVRGGLAMITIGASLFFAEISGSAVADVAALGSILIPAMQRKGYSKEFAAAVTSSSATLAVIIPPSIPMILYAVMSGSSVVELFVAGIVPGLIGGGLMMGIAWLMAVRYDFPVEEAFQLRRVGRTFREAAWALTLPLIILGGIFGGFVTATEGAGLAVVAATVVGSLIYRELDLPHLRKAVLEGGMQTAVVMLLVATSALLGTYLTQARVPQQLAAEITELTTNPLMILMLLNVLFLAIGLFLHSAAAIILVVPIVMPLVRAVGIDPVHFGLVVTLNLGIGQQTPPVASVLVTACSVAKADIWDHTNGSGFYITRGDRSYLDDNYSVFGNVVEGLDVVVSIEQGDRVERVSILRVGADAESYRPDTRSFRRLTAAAGQRVQANAADRILAQADWLARHYSGLTGDATGIRQETLALPGTRLPGAAATRVRYRGVALRYTGHIVEASGAKLQEIPFVSQADGRPAAHERAAWFEPVPELEGIPQALLESLRAIEPGERRQLVLPSWLAYGRTGLYGPDTPGMPRFVISPDTMLVFEVERESAA